MSFLVTYGPAAQITCVVCWKSTRIIPDPEGAITPEVLAHYKRTHVCGTDTGPWDVDDVNHLDDVHSLQPVDSGADLGGLERR